MTLEHLLLNIWGSEVGVIYPLVNIQKANWKFTMLFIGKSSINGPFSIANCSKFPEGNTFLWCQGPSSSMHLPHPEKTMVGTHFQSYMMLVYWRVYIYIDR
jgi:hypothetical protein